jgi:uncharacterized protein
MPFLPSAARLRRVLSLAALLSWGCAGHAPPPTAAAAEAQPNAASSTPAPAAPPGLFLYAAERDGATTLLLGTIHLGFGFEQVLTREAKQRFQAARLVIAEMDPDAAAAQQVMDAGMLPRGESVRGLVGDALYAALVQRLGPRMPEPVLASMKPWLIGVVIAMDELTQALDKRGPEAQTHRMDEEMLAAAKQRGLARAYLETAEEQLRFLESVPVSEQRDELAHMLTEEAHAQTEAMVDAYARGDEAALTAACFSPEHMARAPRFFEQMLYARNARWLPVVLAEHARGGSFVGVGVAHLLGPQGLLASLSAQGFAVHRVY